MARSATWTRWLMVQSYFIGNLSDFPVDTNQDGWWPEAFCTPTPPPTKLTTQLPGDVTMEFVLCPAGSFQMGSNDGRDWSWCYPCEQPVHTVTFAEALYMQATEVTQGQWQAIMGGNPASGSDYGVSPDHPVYNVSWNDCQTFITNLNAHITSTGQGPATYRLPSEAEWEYACRAGTTTPFSFGDSNCNSWSCDDCDLSQYAWWCGNNGSSGTPTYGAKPVGRKMPNAWGLFDMHGNVHEWCQDWWHDDYNDAPADGSAWIDPAGSERILRDGTWNINGQYCRSSSRHWYDPTYRWHFYGFRLARSVAP